MTATNSTKKVKLRNLFHIASNPKKTLFSLDFYVIALSEMSELISNWRINQHQLISVLRNIDKRFLNFLTIIGMPIIEHAHTALEGTLMQI